MTITHINSLRIGDAVEAGGTTMIITGAEPAAFVGYSVRDGKKCTTRIKIVNIGRSRDPLTLVSREQT